MCVFVCTKGAPASEQVCTCPWRPLPSRGSAFLLSPHKDPPLVPAPMFILGEPWSTVILTLWNVMITVVRSSPNMIYIFKLVHLDLTIQALYMCCDPQWSYVTIMFKGKITVLRAGLHQTKVRDGVTQPKDRCDPAQVIDPLHGLSHTTPDQARGANSAWYERFVPILKQCLRPRTTVTLAIGHSSFWRTLWTFKQQLTLKIRARCGISIVLL